MGRHDSNTTKEQRHPNANISSQLIVPAGVILPLTLLVVHDTNGLASRVLLAVSSSNSSTLALRNMHNINLLAPIRPYV